MNTKARGNLLILVGVFLLVMATVGLGASSARAHPVCTHEWLCPPHPGNVVTTDFACSSANINHYSTGQRIYIAVSNFEPNSNELVRVEGLPGSTTPGIIFSRGILTDSNGNACVFVYAVGNGESGTYRINVGQDDFSNFAKSDNYRVMQVTPEPTDPPPSETPTEPPPTEPPPTDPPTEPPPSETPTEPPPTELPDLIVSSLTVSSLTATSIEYCYDVKNIGAAPANLDGPTAVDWDNVTVQAFVSADTVWRNAGDIAAGGTILGVSPLGFLNPGDTFSRCSGAGISVDSSATPYLLLMVDWREDLVESDETNNVTATLIQ